MIKLLLKKDIIYITSNCKYYNLSFTCQGTTVLVIQYGRLRAVRTTGVLFVYWLLQLIAAVLILQSKSRSAASQVGGCCFNS